ncbi:hypothetical protein [Gottfriedia solisilvae]|uniref:hypothetical protein n=1 Tax=Gottfriedia solisilvae TaxID=1516104 RepID=UPI003D2EEF1D
MKLKSIFIVSLILLVIGFIEFNTRGFHQNKCGQHMKRTKCAIPEISPEAVKAEKIAKADLTSHERIDLTNDDAKGNVQKTYVSKDTARLVNDQYDGNEVFKVTYSTKNEDILGDIVVYVDAETFKVIGRGFRE